MWEDTSLLGPNELTAVASLVDYWLEHTLAENPVLVAVERDAAVELTERRWFARVKGEAKETSTICLTLRQRMLHHETYVMPAPEENHAEFYGYLLQRNSQQVGASFSVGDEEAIFLIGAIPATTVTEAELDRILGTIWAAVERYFQPALRIGFASRFIG